jgi:hypothetical protein
VVTGHDADGRAVVASDTMVDGLRPALTPGIEFHRLWGADEVPSFPDDGAEPDYRAYFPSVGGFRFAMVTVPPQSQSGPGDIDDIAGAFAEFEAALPGLAGHMEPGAPGMHTTATIDFEIVLEGEVWLELDDGVEVHLRRGKSSSKTARVTPGATTATRWPASPCSSSVPTTSESRLRDRDRQSVRWLAGGTGGGRLGSVRNVWTSSHVTGGVTVPSNATVPLISRLSSVVLSNSTA